MLTTMGISENHVNLKLNGCISEQPLLPFTAVTASHWSL